MQNTCEFVRICPADSQFSLNSAMREKVRRYFVIFFSSLSICNLLAKFSTNWYMRGKAVNRNSRLDQRVFTAVQLLT